MSQTHASSVTSKHSGNAHESIINRMRPSEPQASTNSKNYLIEYPFRRIPRKTDQINALFSFFELVSLFALNIVLVFPLVTILFFTMFIPFTIFRSLLFKCLHCSHLVASSQYSMHETPDFLSPIELFWYLNSEFRKETNSLRGPKSIGAGVFFIEGYLSKSTVRDLINNKIIQASLRSPYHEFSRFSERILKVFGFGYVWVRTPQFNLDEHIIEIDNAQANLKTDKDLQAYISDLLVKQNFSLNKPLWNLYYLKSFGQNLSDKTSVMIFLYHESFSSGVSLMRLFLKGLVDNRNAFDLKPRYAYFSLNISIIKQFLFSWIKMVHMVLLGKRDQNPLTHRYCKSERFKMLKLKPVSFGNQTVTWSEPFSLIMLNRIKLVTRSKMNDLLTATLAGVLRNYLKKKGINNPFDMKMVMPVDLTSNKYPFKIKNNSTMVCIRMPVNTEGSIPRLWMTKIKTSKLKNCNDFLFFHFFVNSLFYLLPNRVAFWLVERVLNRSTFQGSTLGAGDSTLSTLSICNRNLKGLIYFNPVISNIKISFAIVTYGDEVRLSLQADTGIISNPDLITSEFIKQLENLTDLLANRRIPGEVKRIVRPIVESFAQSSSVTALTNEVSIEEMQHKIAEIQQELQILSENLNSLDQNSSDYIRQKQIILIKSDRLRKEFRSLLIKLQIRQNLHNQTIPSDDEDELDPNERVRLRSSSIASKISVGSNSTSKRNRESSSEHSNCNLDKIVSSRKGSNCAQSRNGSMSFASGISNEMHGPNVHSSSVNMNCLTVENELTTSKKQISFYSASQSNVNKETKIMNELNEFYYEDM
ncbi:Diacylglycerol O-acyltransferase Rv1760-like protein [Brachionus plicatilis]|uniref:Diacylglycerol O-acyltransferase Rv1760-like protein n=1 Tax=Brachionus plicatilis TaxID=10195 RepID=A0A3M7T2X1_BRAPC|nr:Diacylglycerol O-acyltransferase Rv1760-like protein [Brachionus plicatilis]